MTSKQYKTNLNCASCVDAVKPHLDGERKIHHWEVNTASPNKVLTVAGEGISRGRVAELVGKAGFKVLDEIEAVPAVETDATAGPAPSYYPLVLVVAFLVGLVTIAEFRAETFDWTRVMTNFMGGFFIAFSFFKLLDVRAFADAYAGYDILARRSRAYALAYPFIELALGVAYLANIWPLATSLVTFAVMVVGSVGVIQSLLNRRKIRCACLGAVFNLPMSTVTLLEDGLMAVMAAVMVAHLMIG